MDQKCDGGQSSPEQKLIPIKKKPNLSSGEKMVGAQYFPLSQRCSSTAALYRFSNGLAKVVGKMVVGSEKGFMHISKTIDNLAILSEENGSILQ